MNEETLWILKKLAAQEISAQFADRLLRALELLQKAEDGELVDDSTPEPVELVHDEPVELVQENTVWPEISAEMPLLGDDGVNIIENIQDGTQLILEKTGNITIQGWSNPYIKAEGETKGKLDLSTVLKTGKSLKIWSESDTILYIPSAVTEINIANGSGSIDIRKYPNDIIIDSDTGEINISEASGSMKIDSFEGGITLENCRGKISLESNSGHIILSDVDGDIDVKTNSGDIGLERCRGQSIDVKSGGGYIVLRDTADSMGLNDGTVDIRVESDGGNINIDNCQANIYIESGKGDVLISGGDLSIDGMGKVELRMKAGDARLHQHSFKNLNIVIEEGNIELAMEKLTPSGMRQISVHKGNVNVEVLPDFGCELTALGSKERMYIELPMEIIERDKNRLRGILNGGGGKMEVIAPDGDIRFCVLKSPHIRSIVENSANDL